MSTRPRCPLCGKASHQVYRQLTEGQKSVGFKSIDEARECRRCGVIFEVIDGQYPDGGPVVSTLPSMPPKP